MASLVLLDRSVSSEIVKHPVDSITLDECEKWLKTRRVLPADAQLLEYADRSPWERAGSETFVCRASALYTSGGQDCTVDFIVKALVGLFPEEQEKK
jgi:hypothetical protein